MISFASCTKEIMEYNGREGVYFDVRNGTDSLAINRWPHQPYSNVDFARLGGSVVEYPLKVTITGPVKDFDRSFRVEVNPDSTTAVLGQHYEALEGNWNIASGAISTMIRIRLKRAADLQQGSKTLGLRLVATEDFSLSFPEWDAIPSYNAGTVIPKFNASLHTLRINDVMVRPAIWNGSANASNQETGALGFFTRKKMEFLIENLGVKYEEFANSQTMPLARIILLSNDGAAILMQRYHAGNPILEDDGRLMFMGNVTWRSIIGVPWVPGS